MSPGPTFDRVYPALKAGIVGGCFPPGAHLEPAVLGEALNASITPVRDALHRLVGERLVEAPRNDGFRVLAPTEAELRDLLGWRRALLELALRHRGGSGPATLIRAEPGPAASRPIDELFMDIACGAPSLEHQAAIASLNERLGAASAAAAQLFDNVEEERAALGAALDGADLPALRRQVALYHKRRQRRVSDLLIAMRHPVDQHATR